MSSAEPFVTTGYLGWSNTRGGCEVYPDHGGRWADSRHPDQPQLGHLLVDDLADQCEPR